MSDAGPKHPRGDGYEVGYGKPPKHTRFKPGQSGNPKGRPKGTKNLKTDLIEELSETIDIREGGGTRRISKQRAVVKSLAARAIKGDARAASLLASLMLRLLDTGEGALDVEEGLTEEEAAIVQNYIDRAQRRGDHPAPEPKRDEGEAEAES